MAKPIQAYGGPLLVGPTGVQYTNNSGRIDVIDPPQYYPMPVPPRQPPVVYPPQPVITHPHPPARHKKPKPHRGPLPPIRVSPPIIQPQPPQPPTRHTWHGRHAHPPRRHHPVPLGPPVYVPPVTETPAPVVVAPPVASGPKCPNWGWMVRTNPDGSETVVACTPGQTAAAGLHGLDGINEVMTGYLGPNWMMYAAIAAGAWFFLKRR